MKTISTLTWLAALAAVLQAATAVGETTGGPVVIRTYDYTDIRLQELERAWEEARLIFEDAGIAVSWKSCPVTPPPNGATGVDSACRELLQPNELVLRLMASASSPSGPAGRRVSLGYSLIDSRSDSGPLLMTVFPDLVGAIARGAGADPVSLLGRAIAHELGHLLLGTVTHSPDGLMRPLWSRNEIGRNARRDWLFRLQQGRQMRARLASRNGN